MKDANGLTSSGGEMSVEEPKPSRSLRKYSAATQAIHADDYLNRIEDVAPPLHVATTFRYHNDPDQLNPAAENVHTSINHPRPLQPSNQADPHSPPPPTATSTLAKPPPPRPASKPYSPPSSTPPR